MLIQLFAALLTLLPLPAYATDTWQLPQELSDSNTKISFEVDSTWHLVLGSVSGLTGRVWLSDPKDPTSIQAEFKLPVVNFNTDNSRRDKRMREVMLADQFSDVVVRVSAMDKEQRCTPERVESEGSCAGMLLGGLTIRGIEREMRLPYTISMTEGGFQIEGQLPFEWSAFNIEDPSILIAKLAKVVTVKYATSIPKAKHG